MSTTATATKAKKYRFRLLVGQHVDGEGPDGAERKFQAVPGTAKMKPVNPIIETNSDLGVFNCPGSRPKFQNLAGETTATDPTIRQPGETLAVFLGRLKELTAAAESETIKMREELTNMSLEQMLDFAAAEDIELSDEANEAAVRQEALAQLD